MMPFFMMHRVNIAKAKKSGANLRQYKNEFIGTLSPDEMNL
jgi:hypothetical protein